MLLTIASKPSDGGKKGVSLSVKQKLELNKVEFDVSSIIYATEASTSPIPSTSHSICNVTASLTQNKSY